MKRCFKCQCVKPLDQFYKHSHMRDGRLNKCMDCTRQDVRANRSANAEHYQAFERSRAMQPTRVAARRAYASTDEGKRAFLNAQRRSRSKHVDRMQARSHVAYAIQCGTLTPWPACAVPDCNCKPEAHHPDYSRPLDVVWLCPTHHKQAHALISQELLTEPQ